MYILRVQLFIPFLGKRSPNYLYKLTKVCERAIVFALYFRRSSAIFVCILKHFIVDDKTVTLITFGG